MIRPFTTYHTFVIQHFLTYIAKDSQNYKKNIVPVLANYAIYRKHNTFNNAI